MLVMFRSFLALGDPGTMMLVQMCSITGFCCMLVAGLCKGRLLGLGRLLVGIPSKIKVLLSMLMPWASCTKILSMFQLLERVWASHQLYLVST